MIELIMDPRFTPDHYDEEDFVDELSSSLVYSIEFGHTDVAMRMLNRWTHVIDVNVYEEFWHTWISALDMAVLKGNLTDWCCICFKMIRCIRKQRLRHPIIML